MKRFISNAIANYIIADAKRKGKRPPPFEVTRALVEQQSWKKIIWLSAKTLWLTLKQKRGKPHGKST